MNKKLILTVLISVFLCVSIDSQCCEFVAGNPIPVPTLIMPKEYINATISTDEHGIVYAEVNGLYPFHNVQHEKVTMYYPVPPDSSEISVMMNETSLEWSYSDRNYSTVIGEFPMIEWVMEPVPDYFEIRTQYQHPLPKDGSYSFLYAMGTGRYLQSYAKETTAYVSINISKQIAPTWRSINVHTIRYNETTEKWLWKPANYTIAHDGDTWSISLTEVSKPFWPLMEDLLLTIEAGGIVSGINDRLELTMNIPKTSIVAADVMNFSFTLRNVGNDTLMVFFGSSQRWDVFLYYMGFPITRWSYGKVFLLFVSELYLTPNETFNGTLEWNFFMYDRGKYIPPDPGLYDISGFCVGKPTVMTRRLTIELILPDLNHDGMVNIIDIAKVALAFGSRSGEPNWDLNADVNDDEVIDVRDITIVAVNFKKIY